MGGRLFVRLFYTTLEKKQSIFGEKVLNDKILLAQCARDSFVLLFAQFAGK